MPSIPYRMTFLDSESARVAEEVKERRGGRLLNLDRMLLHCPAIAEGWGALMSRVRAGRSISPRHRELAICAVSYLNGAQYELHYHRDRLLQAGFDKEQLDALRDVPAAAQDEALFGPADRAVLRLALESTRAVTIGPQTWVALKACFPDPAQLIELTMVVASYNMVSRVEVGLGVEIEGAEAA